MRQAVVQASAARGTLAASPEVKTLSTRALARAAGQVALADAFKPLSRLAMPLEGSTPYVLTASYVPFNVDFATLKQTLAAAPKEFSKAATDSPLIIGLPAPDGSLQRFKIVESSIMEDGLAKQFPDIKTFAAQGVDDPTATARLDYTMFGFHAQVISPNGTWYIDPYLTATAGTTQHVSYAKRDVIASADEAAWQCLGALSEPVKATGRTPIAAALSTEPPPTTANRSGTQLRTYRTAVAATGEYTAVFGGTVAGGQAAIVTAINRVTGVYETELSIRLTLVANNSSVVYTNASTDPYSNTNAGTILTQNQTNLDSVIGTANYDIGHVFSTGSGGLAGLGVVGVAGNKARGTTGLPSPIGDAFYIDYVAHEMGHQFGANHTFNTAFDTGNRNGTTAMEPGSGSTIMAYAGLEGTDDLQSNSDPYFHSISFDEIITYVDVTRPSVGTRTATGNSVPTVSAGSSFTIPVQTPFALTATGSDPNGDTLTYSWEQRDVGAATNLTTADNGASPLFRVYNPTTSPTRTLPRLASILSGANSTVGPGGGSNLVERLPTVARTMKWRVTARDNRAGGGGVNTSDVNIVVVNPGLGGFLITNLNAATTVNNQTPFAINWNVAGTTANGINAANVRITLSTDGGNTFNTVLASSTANDGTENVTIPAGITSTTARFRVEAVGNIFFDINNANITIASPPVSATPAAPSLAAASDTGTSSADGLTRLNNNGAGNVLQFTVGGTVPGATVEVLADGVVIGSAVASGTSTTITTNGATVLADGARSIAARQTESGKAVSLTSAGTTITVDTVAPTAQVAAVSPNPRVTAVASVGVSFSESVAGLDIADFGLSRNAAAVTLTGASVSGSASSYTVNGLSTLTVANGAYTLTLNSGAGPAVTDLAGNLLAANAATSWNKFLIADMNNDGAVNNLDIAPFVQALTNPAGYAAAFPDVPGTLVGDVNTDGAFNNLDIAPFVALLTSTGPGTVSSRTASSAPRTGTVTSVFGSTPIGSTDGSPLGTRDEQAVLV
jgi:hypothetical protein